jgi:starch synthase (maltosyl-transferring)
MNQVNPHRQLDHAPDAGASDSALPPAIYYLHPLLAGPLAGWDRHFARAARLGFNTVLTAPPFATGRGGNVFLTADHWRLDDRLGGGDAREALALAARAAERAGLRLMLDIVADRVAADGPLARDNSGWFTAAPLDAVPDPRIPPDTLGAATWRHDGAGEAARQWWSDRIAEWLGCGIAGFRCVEAWRVDGAWWRALIGGLRAASGREAATSFIADATGGRPAQVAGLAGARFDFAVSSSAWWDFRAGWLADDAARIAEIAPAIAMAEAPFGARLHGRAAALRALEFAACYGTGWLLPMGLEFGARRPLDPVRDTPEVFEALVAAPPFDLAEEIATANTARARLPALQGTSPAIAVTPADAPLAAFLRPDPAGRGDALVFVVNPSDTGAAHLPTAALLPELGQAYAGFREVGDTAVLTVDAAIEVPAAGLRLLETVAAPPILRPAPSGDQAARAAALWPRIAIEAVNPSVDGGRFPVKRVTGEHVEVSADIICDGHDKLGVVLAWRAADEDVWQEVAMANLGNDRWAASFPLTRLGRHEFTVVAWKDQFATFSDELEKKHAAGVPLALELEEGRTLLLRAGAHDATLRVLAERLASADETERLAALRDPDTRARMVAADPRPHAVRHQPAIPVDAERRAARFASWYELFPRSQTSDPQRHGTFRDVIARLPAIRDMGFDVLYFPPIHPIGKKNRKGRNNSLTPAPEDPGSPYAIGSPDGGHDAIHPELGTLEDFRALRDAAARHGLELALDFAIQCSPDHPWLREHPDWFDWRPDGTIRYAENPPKKYEDIVNVDFYAEAGERGPGAIPGLWLALRDIVLFWAEEGVRTFRVDNPHTKPLPFWEWMIGEVRGRFPDTLFLAEAFTKPKMMYRLAKVGFSQSYTYFTWRNTKAELTEYLTELSTTAPKDFFRPNFFVNTPDINPPFLHDSGRPGFLLRAALATTLSGLWGMYNGFEICEARAVPGKEEYLDSEKYQIRVWDWSQPGNIIAEITRLNRIRRANPALHSHLGIRFHPAYNDNILFFSKATPDRSNVVLVAVSLDPRGVQEADVELPLWDWKVPDEGALRAQDLMRDTGFVWHGKYQRIRLDPNDMPFAIWRVTPA